MKWTPEMVAILLEMKADEASLAHIARRLGVTKIQISNKFNLLKSREKSNARQRRAYARDPQKAKDYTKKWVADNPEKIKAQRKAYSDAHKQERSAHFAKWYAANKEALKAKRAAKKAQQSSTNLASGAPDRGP
ncbi:MAG: hypothetical protein ABL951_02720 [Alphaproteobacteria bacterium]